MMNLDRTGDTVVSWICGLATISTAIYLLDGGSSISAPPSSIAAPPARARVRGSCSRSPAGLDPAALPRPAAVVRHRRDVLDAHHLEPRGGERPDGGLAPRARALHVHVDLLQAVLLRAPGGGLRRELRGKRGGLP